MEDVKSSLQLVLLYSGLFLAVAVSKPKTNPMQDEYIAFNSEENVTYTCSVDSVSTVVWEVERSQIRSQQQFDNIRNQGIFIDPMNTSSMTSTISISSMARNNNSNITIQCLASHGISSVEGDRYSVITFNLAIAPGDLVLQPALTLEWTRPANLPSPENVDVNYTIIINNTENNGMILYRNVTSLPSLSVHFLEEVISKEGSQCVEFEFIVSATTDAGTGPPTRILDTVPISPDVSSINSRLQVERVDLQTSAVDISFPPVQPCSTNFPLTNYTLNIDSTVSTVLSPSGVISGIPITLLGLLKDNSFSLTITACNEVTCRTSIPRRINTTDVQSAHIVFFKNHLYLHCFFADNSKAQGCIVRFTLSSSTKESESFQVSRESGSLCTSANNQHEAYSNMIILDWEENGMEGNVSLNITAGSVVTVPTLIQYTELTGCKEEGRSNSSAVVGAVLGTLTVILIITVTITITIVFLLGWRKKKVEETADFATLTRKKKLVAKGEKEHLVYGCDVPAGNECAKRIETDLSAHLDTENKTEEIDLPIQLLKKDDDKPAWIEGHDDPNQPLTINVRWKPLVQALVDSNSLMPGTKPLLPQGKVQWQLHMDD